MFCYVSQVVRLPLILGSVPESCSCEQKLVYKVGALPTKVVCLTQVVSADELKDDEEYEDIMEDMRLEAGKYLLLISAELEFTSPSFPFLNMPFLTPIVSDSIGYDD